MTFQAPPPDAPRGDGGNYAGYILWHAQGSGKHGLPPASWSINVETGRVPFPPMSTGCVWNIENIITGWENWPDGGQKIWHANPAPHTPLPYPGAGFTEGVKIPMAVDANTVVMWDQASVGAWKGFCQVAAILGQQAPQNPGMYPVIQFAGSTLTSTGKNSTQVPNFQILQWVPQPACFAAQAQPPAPPPEQGWQQPAAAPPQQPAPPPQQPAPPPAAAPQGGAWDAGAPAAGQPVPAAAPAPAPAAAPAGAWNG